MFINAHAHIDPSDTFFIFFYLVSYVFPAIRQLSLRKRRKSWRQPAAPLPNHPHSPRPPLHHLHSPPPAVHPAPSSASIARAAAALPPLTHPPPPSTSSTPKCSPSATQLLRAVSAACIYSRRFPVFFYCHFPVFFYSKRGPSVNQPRCFTMRFASGTRAAIAAVLSP